MSPEVTGLKWSHARSSGPTAVTQPQAQSEAQSPAPWQGQSPEQRDGELQPQAEEEEEEGHESGEEGEREREKEKGREGRCGWEKKEEEGCAESGSILIGGARVVDVNSDIMSKLLEIKTQFLSATSAGTPPILPTAGTTPVPTAPTGTPTRTHALGAPSLDTGPTPAQLHTTSGAAHPDTEGMRQDPLRYSGGVPGHSVVVTVEDGPEPSEAHGYTHGARANCVTVAVEEGGPCKESPQTHGHAHRTPGHSVVVTVEEGPDMGFPQAQGHTNGMPGHSLMVRVEEEFRVRKLTAACPPRARAHCDSGHRRGPCCRIPQRPRAHYGHTGPPLGGGCSVWRGRGFR